MKINFFAALIILVVLLFVKMNTNQDYIISIVDEQSEDIVITDISSCTGRRYISCSVLFENIKTKGHHTIRMSAHYVPVINKAIKNKQVFSFDYVKISKGETGKKTEWCVRRLLTKNGEKSELEEIYPEDTYQYKVGTIPPMCKNSIGQVISQ